MADAGLGAWNDFFAAVAGVAATLIGLLFVALALNPARIGRHGAAGLRTYAAQSFHSFLVVLVVALVALIPDSVEDGLGVTLLIVGGSSLVRVGLDARRVRRDPSPEWHGGQALTRFAAPGAAHAVAVWVGWRLLAGDAGAVGWLVAVVFLLLMSAASSCWDLLQEMGDNVGG